MTLQEAIASYKNTKKQLELRINADRIKMDMAEVKDDQYYIDQTDWAIRGLETLESLEESDKEYNDCESGKWRYWYLASPHMKDICKSLNDLHDKYDGDIQVEKMVMNHQNYIVLYRYWDHPKGWPSDYKMLDGYDEDAETEKENFGDPEKKTGIYDESSFDERVKDPFPSRVDPNLAAMIYS